MSANVHTIDRMPEVERKKVLNRVLAGETLTSVAASIGISRQAMSSWHNRVVKPAISVAQKAQSMARAHDDSPILSTKAHIAEQQSLTRDLVRASPLMERHQFLWEKTQDGINSASDSKDLAALPALLNQGHKSIELLGKITGELTEKDAVNLNIIIAIPDTETRHVNTSDNGCYDMQLD